MLTRQATAPRRDNPRINLTSS